LVAVGDDAKSNRKNIPVIFVLAVYIDYQYSVSARICLTLRLNRQPRKKKITISTRAKLTAVNP
jgi:hypothetical protein